MIPIQYLDSDFTLSLSSLYLIPLGLLFKWNRLCVALAKLKEPVAIAVIAFVLCVPKLSHLGQPRIITLTRIIVLGIVF